MYDSYNTTLDTLHAFAEELSNQFQWGTRFYEGLEMFEVKPIVDGIITYSVTGYDVEQPIHVSYGVSMPDIVKKYMLEKEEEEPEDYEDNRDLAFIGFHILPGDYDIIKVIPYVDYRHVDIRAYAEGRAKLMTLEELKADSARYAETLELMLVQL